jgi:hypothetical protein
MFWVLFNIGISIKIENCQITFIHKYVASFILFHIIIYDLLYFYLSYTWH